MKQHRFYHPPPLVEGSTLCLSTEICIHILRVLRLSKGTVIMLFDGHNRQAEAVINHCDKKTVMVSVRCVQHVSRESELQLHLLQGLSKGDRFDWVLQKAVELGVSEFTPLISERTVVRLAPDRMAKKMQHWRGIIVNASAQCGRNQLMTLHPPVDFDSYCLRPASSAYRLMLQPESSPLSEALGQTPDNKAELVIGPEGGFSNEELNQAQLHGFSFCHLGPRVLRTETAAVIACGLLQAYWGDLATVS